MRQKRILQGYWNLIDDWEVKYPEHPAPVNQLLIDSDFNNNNVFGKKPSGGYPEKPISRSANCSGPQSGNSPVWNADLLTGMQINAAEGGINKSPEPLTGSGTARSESPEI